MAFGSLDVQIECFPFFFPLKQAPSPVFIQIQQTAAWSLPTVHARDLKATLSLRIANWLPMQLSYFLSHIVNQAFAKPLLVEPHDFYQVSWSIRAISLPQRFILLILKFTENLKEEFNEHCFPLLCKHSALFVVCLPFSEPFGSKIQTSWHSALNTLANVSLE